MRVDLQYDGSLLIVPETDFEINWLERFDASLGAFHKHGEGGEYAGIKLKVKNKPMSHRRK